MIGANRHTACAVCNGEAGLIGIRRLPDGSRVCRSCQTAIPASFLEERYVTAEDARNGAAYGKEAMEILSPAFTATSQYGRMFLDERNGLFTVCDATSIGKDGKLKNPLPGIYPCIAVTEASFSVSPVSTNQRSTVCHVRFTGYMGRYNIHIRETLKKHVSCILIPDGDGGAAWQEPDDLSAFRSCYRQALETSWRRMQATERHRQEEERAERERIQKEQEYRAYQQAQAANKEEEKIREARILFMLGEDYTEAELRQQWAAFMRGFHPDNKHAPDPVYAQKINDAYSLLLNALKGGGAV